MGKWEIVAVLIVILALLSTKAIARNRQSPEDQDTQLGLLLAVILIAVGVAWYFGLHLMSKWR